MSKISLKINPKVGFGELKFGHTIEEILAVVGEAEEVEDIQEEEDFNTVILNYWNEGFSVFIEGSGAEKSIVSCFETDNPKSTLFGKTVFEMTEKQVTEHMKANGYNEIEKEKEKDGEYRLSFDEGLIDFFFDEDGSLLAVNWGVFVNEHGEIEDIIL
jgi:SHS2 domain-containing protein